MNNHLEDCELVELYVLDALSPDEKSAFEAHLPFCEACQESLEQLKEIVDMLPLTAAPLEPPVGMKKRVLGHVFADNQTINDKEVYAAPTVDALDPMSAEQEYYSAQEPNHKTNIIAMSDISDTRRSLSRWRMLAAGLTAASVILGVYSLELKHDVNGYEGQLSASDQQIRSLKNELVASNNPAEGLQVNEAVKLSPQAKDIIAQGLATVVIDKQGTHLLVQAENLPALKGNQAYQVWLIKGNEPSNAGTFLSRDGTGALYYKFTPGQYDTIAITLEPDARGSKPRGRMILAAPIQPTT
ncbi:hypothetical protein J2Z69_000417 [Paenibacillus shirakamiensis]|uniref:Anti-sigma-W factor RsiW n=1 Tax=Paenibacillus shirakamiensis TaxID=1265935 RepID=A0ABS4JCE4_9BACL|nr:anti-sigma factor [Paenibacillus shirakamiensis]MBP1999398.1 hypothetical protein [Paenibacillus shirakamiensis]